MMKKSSRRIAICKVSDVPENGIKQFDAGGKSVCVINAGSQRFFACEAACPHEQIPLCEGVFDGESLTCVEHLWQWNLAENGAPQGLAEKALQMYPVEVDADTVYLSG
jgi:toluene monooxygenase system ferredoxin subunit